MEFTQLSLARGQYRDGKRSVGEGEGEASVGFPMKRKWSTTEEAANNGVVDLHQLKHPLPSDWEQCLDLQSGRMYYVNKKTGMKSWNRPDHQVEHHQKLDLNLNISTSTAYNYDRKASSSSSSKNNGNNNNINNNNNNNMVALACSNCHLLVILCRSSPSCPNCKFVHSLSSKAPINWPV